MANTARGSGRGARESGKSGRSVAKPVLAALGAVLLLAVLTALYAKRNPERFLSGRAGRAAAGLLVTEGALKTAGDRMGFDMENVEVFREQLAAEIEGIKWDSLPPAGKKEYFAEAIKPENLKIAVPAIMKLSADYREEIISAAADLLRDYRVNLTAEEAGVLEEYLRSPEGEARLREARKYLVSGLRPVQRMAMSPLSDEIEALVSEIFYGY